MMVGKRMPCLPPRTQNAHAEESVNHFQTTHPSNSVAALGNRSFVRTAADLLLNNSCPQFNRQKSRRSTNFRCRRKSINYDRYLLTNYSTDEFSGSWLNPSIAGVSQSDLFMIRNPIKAILTIDGGTKKVLTCNETACRLFGVENSELVGRHFDEFCVELKGDLETRPTTADHVLSADRKNLQDVYGKVTEICDKDGLVVPVAVWVRHILQESVDRWLIVLEPVEKLSATCVANEQGILFSCDQKFAELFGYKCVADILGIRLHDLMPSLQIEKDISRQHVAGKSFCGHYFPLTAAVANNADSAGSGRIEAKIDVFTVISGLVVIDAAGVVRCCNDQFTLLLFGMSQEELQGKNIATIIPGFFEQMHNVDDEFRSPTPILRRFGSLAVENEEKFSESPKFFESPKENLRTSTPNLRRFGFLAAENEEKFFESPKENLRTSTPIKSPQENSAPVKSPPENSAPINPVPIKPPEENSVPIKPLQANSGPIIREGRFWCEGQHADGSSLGIGFDVRAIEKSDLFCVWIFRDPEAVSSHHYSLALDARSPQSRIRSSHSRIAIGDEKIGESPPPPVRMEKEAADLVRGPYAEHYHPVEIGNLALSDFGSDFAYIFRQIASAVGYLHSRSIAHRDIKDENVLIDERFTCKLIDFGSAVYCEKGKLFSTFAGTIEYCSPEVLTGHPYSGPELDMWGLGIVLFTIYFRENPFASVDDAIEAQLDYSCSISDGFHVLLSWMLQPNPGLRATIADVEEFYWTCQKIDVDDYDFATILKNLNGIELPPKKFLFELIGISSDESDREEI